MGTEETQMPGQTGNRIRLFVDQWNLELTMRDVARRRGFEWNRFDWRRLPDWIVEEAANVCRISQPRYEGTTVYASFDPNDPEHEQRRKWLEEWLDQQPGVRVKLSHLRPRQGPTCQNCHRRVDRCQHCGEMLRLRQEKGVDTAIVTDMVALAWQGAYDIAVLVSSDSDFIPVVQMLDARGVKVVQAGFPPVGNQLRRACWAQINVFAGREELELRPRSR